MARYRFYFVVQDNQGNTVEDANVSVYLAGTVAPAVVYLNKDDVVGLVLLRSCSLG